MLVVVLSKCVPNLGFFPLANITRQNEVDESLALPTVFVIWVFVHKSRIVGRVTCIDSLMIGRPAISA